MEIGTKLKSIRLENNLTLAELASRCELTTGFLSQIENDISSPSISTLKDILEALGTTLDVFFSEEKKEKKIFSSDDFFEHQTADYLIKWIVPDAQKREMEPIIIEINPKCKSQLIRPHQGEEFGYVLTGTLHLYYGKETLIIKQGETFYLQGNKTHYLFNPNQDKITILWVSTPPSF